MDPVLVAELDGMDPNQIAGKIMRARISGKAELADQMQKVLDLIKSGGDLGLQQIMLPDIGISPPLPRLSFL